MDTTAIILALILSAIFSYVHLYFEHRGLLQKSMLFKTIYYSAAVTLIPALMIGYLLILDLVEYWDEISFIN